MKNLLILSLAVTLSACAPVISNYSAVSTHTLKTAPDKEIDVVWVQQYQNGDFVLMRCTDASGAPTCVHVKTP